MLDKLKLLLTFRPRIFFEKYKNDNTHDAVTFFLVASFFNSVLVILLRQIFASSLFAKQFGLFNLNINPLLYIPLIPTLMVVNLLVLFFAAAVTHMFVHLVKGKEEYGKTLGVLAYSSTPMLLLGWIPLLSFIVPLYSAHIFIVGISSWQKVSKAKAFIVLIGPAILGLLLVILFVFLALTIGWSVLKLKFTGF